MSSEHGRSEGGAIRSSGKGGALLAFADALLSAVQQAQTDASEEVRQLVTFHVRDREYAVPILQCREILRCSAITRIPEAPAHVRGVVNNRGHILPVVDVRTTFGMEPASPTARSRMIVVEAAGRQFALLVDRVARILKLGASAIEPSSEMPDAHAVTGQARLSDGVILIVDAERMLRAGSAAPDPTTRGEHA